VSIDIAYTVDIAYTIPIIGVLYLIAYFEFGNTSKHWFRKMSLHLFTTYSQVAIFHTHHFSSASLGVLYGPLILHMLPSSVRLKNMNALNVRQI